mmetsp:Transcript_857/g.2703  ORF Transcript_857/g.2703 Transcript_857/m.2703 type:complete len:201 (+) Transcript_857:729-1331(+)
MNGTFFSSAERFLHNQSVCRPTWAALAKIMMLTMPSKLWPCTNILSLSRQCISGKSAVQLGRLVMRNALMSSMVADSPACSRMMLVADRDTFFVEGGPSMLLVPAVASDWSMCCSSSSITAKGCTTRSPDPSWAETASALSSPFGRTTLGTWRPRPGTSTMPSDDLFFFSSAFFCFSDFIFLAAISACSSRIKASTSSER